ncbi:histidine phosphatase family protein [Azonexus sp.]|uniref:histidine phosphatase family protein n=1 Tax=Azonexus sp. TaxID=1872668 RepID=UPI0027BA5F9C|nr:histidine phosphatase family protein [Azonexus sp.]
MRRRILLSIMFCLLPASLFAQTPVTAVDSPFVEKMATREQLAQLRQGGFVLYIRHGNTDNSRPDQFPKVDLNDCNTQRPLNDAGRQLMREVGKEIRAARIPVGELLVSPMCRTRESANLAFGDKFTVTESLMYSANMTSEEKKPRLAALKKILGEPVAAGTNRVLLAHAPNLADLIGFFVKPEGTVVIFAQRGPNNYEYVASIPPALWSKLR